MCQMKDFLRFLQYIVFNGGLTCILYQINTTYWDNFFIFYLLISKFTMYPVGLEPTTGRL